MKKVKAGLMAAIAATVLAACGSSETESEEKGETWREIQEEGEIVVATPGTLYPASYYPEDSDELTGYDVEVMREVGERLDLEIVFEEMDFDSMFASLTSGRVDVAPAGMREEIKDKYSYSEPYKYSYATMIVREEDVESYDSLEDLEGKVAGGAATTVYSDIAEKFGAELKTYGNVTNDVYLRDVDVGRTDVIINDYYLQRLALESLPQLDVTMHPDLKFHTNNQRAVIEEGAHTFRDKIDGALDEMRKDGTLTELSKEFFGGEDVSEKPEEDIREIEGIE
ncbi:amino acid ABC transporter extracellular binding protein [Salimicrobium jeotgali]|uniref:Amino acid ABC transporter extracellular binding protein n=3 Tax=Salimicrobium TaxID=351195 RepID=K2GAD3_9BACI|nr:MULTISPECIES: transporter substrate-binding domain-containing protein [Salimicrobium]EKE32033.1 amino acid ABC transporter extracellular binding protein [Salimicrobium jeotgali]MBM7695999.1 cystine transport system substrate-binding protein [Salimicrobium jeotgali]SIS88049.1 amino acid ABC transporter substrate-binding protein, PAAT family [Salimicrobium salexigens]